MPRLVWLSALVLLAALAAAWLSFSAPGPPPPAPDPAVVEQAFAYKPDPAVATRASIPREPKTAAEQIHTHVALRISVNGGPIYPPSNLGIVDAGRPLAVHAHDRSGVVHLHQPRERLPYTLQDVLAVWGIKREPGKLAGLPLGSGAGQWQAQIWHNRQRLKINASPSLADRDDLIIELVSQGFELGSRPPLERFDFRAVPLVDS